MTHYKELQQKRYSEAFKIAEKYGYSIYSGKYAISLVWMSKTHIIEFFDSKIFKNTRIFIYSKNLETCKPEHVFTCQKELINYLTDGSKYAN